MSYPKYDTAECDNPISDFSVLSKKNRRLDQTYDQERQVYTGSNMADVSVEEVTAHGQKVLFGNQMYVVFWDPHIDKILDDTM